MNIYFLRHGETTENIKGTYYGNLDVSLNKRGIEQAKKASQIINKIDFEMIYTSCLKRTIETSEIIFEKNKYSQILNDNRINEINFGIFEGKTYEQIGKLYEEEQKMWNANWKEYSPPKGESYHTFYERVKNFIEEMKNLPYENILLITHGGVIRAAYCYILNENLDFYWKFASKTGDLSLIKYEKSYFYIDSITHIG